MTLFVNKNSKVLVKEKDIEKKDITDNTVKEEVKNLKSHYPAFGLTAVLFLFVYVCFVYFAEIPDLNKIAENSIRGKPPINLTLYKQYFVDDSCLKLVDKYLEEQYMILAAINLMPKKDKDRFNAVKNRIDKIEKYKELHPDLVKNVTNHFNFDLRNSIREAKSHRFDIFFTIYFLLSIAIFISFQCGIWYYDPKDKKQDAQLAAYVSFLILLAIISIVYYYKQCFSTSINMEDYLPQARCPLREVTCQRDCASHIEYSLNYWGPNDGK